jgi:hypothetical protein
MNTAKRRVVVNSLADAKAGDGVLDRNRRR